MRHFRPTRRSRRPLIGILAASAAFLLGVCGCKEKGRRDEDEPIQTVSTGAAGKVVTTHLVPEASKLGFAGRIPADVEVYLGLLHVRHHFEELQKTRFYQDLTAYLEDRTPVPSADGRNTAPATALPLWSDDSFLAVGKGGAAFFGLAAGMAESNRQRVFTQLLGQLGPLFSFPTPTSGPVSGTTDGLEFPPLLIGVKSDDPDTLLQSMISAGQRKNFAKLGPSSTMTLADGGKFMLHEGKVDALLEGSTADEGIRTVLAKLKGKSFSVAWGSTGGYALVALGNACKALEFAQKPEDSILSRSEWGFLTPQVNDSLLAFGWIDSAVMQAAGSGSKVAATLRSLLDAAPKESPLAGLGQALKERLDALTASEQRYFAQSLTHATFGAWWQQGLRVEMMGGLTPEDLGRQAPLKFSALLDESQLLYGLSTRLGEAERERFTDYLESWGALLQAAAWKVFEQKAAAAGEDKKLRQWLESDVLSPVHTLYGGLKEVGARGLGLERAYLIHLAEPSGQTAGGRADPRSASWSLPLLAHLSDVRSRQILQETWLKMDPSLTALGKAFPMLAGGEPFVPDLDTQDGMNIYFLGLPYPSPELSPSVGVSDRALLITSSRTLCSEIASNLARPPEAGDALISQWRLNVPLLRKWLQNASRLPIESGTAGSFSQWMASLGDLRGRTSLSNGKVRRQWTWDIRDPRRFD